MPFLQDVAKEIHTKAKEWGNYVVVCPNKRTIDYIKHYLSQIVRKTIWSPKFMNLSELINSFSDLEPADDLVLNIELFKSFKKITAGTKFFANYDFEKFQGIGEIILKDFNEIDNYLVDVRQIFTNIADYERIDYIDDILTDEQKNALKEFLGFYSADKLSEEKEYFLELWAKIPEIYDDFSIKLLSQKKGYNGLIIKQVYQNFIENKIDFNNYEKYIFVGFNALTKAQKIILNELKKQKKALFFWDYDNFYLKDYENEAGLFIRQNIEYLSDDLKINRDIFLSEKNITLTGFPLEIAQTKALPTLLRKMGIDFSDKKQLAKTAIIMPDEKLLFPVLHSLPPDIQKINVTVGFPFVNTSVFSLLMKWLKLLQKFITDKNIFIADIEKFLDNHLLREILNTNYNFIINKIKSQKKIHISLEDLQRFDYEIIRIFFEEENIHSPDVLLENLLKILEIVFRTVSAENRTVETEAVYQFYTQLLNFKSLIANELQTDKDLLTIRILIKYLIHQLASTHIPFTGKSLEGLQVMTLMETRNIDFENIIFINLNEQIIPHKASQNSLISEFMRRSFGLPVLKYQDAIFAYLFYRILQRAKNISLTYSNLLSDKSAEISRFVQQLIYETDLIKPENHSQYSEKISPLRPSEIIIEKNDEIYQKLSEYLCNAHKSMSASSLNTYVSCPLKFYFKYIAKIKPPEEPENYQIDAIQFGQIFHNSAEELLQPFINQEFTKENIKTILQNSEATINKYIVAEVGGDPEALKTGINTVLSKIISLHIKNMLDFEKQRLPFVIKGTEKKFYGKIDFQLDKKPCFVSILSIFDRIDEKNGTTYIIDYKTGNVKLDLKNVEVLFSSKTDYRLKGYFQMLLYSLIYRQNNSEQNFVPLIYLIDKIKANYSASLIYNKMQVSSTSSVLSDFEELLQNLLSEIFNKEIPFVQTENDANCLYCEFKGICGK